MIDVGDTVTVDGLWPDTEARTFAVWKVDPPLFFARELEPPKRNRAFPLILARNESDPAEAGPSRTEAGRGSRFEVEDNMRTGESA